MKNSVFVVADQALLSFHMTNVKSVCAGRGQVLIALAKLSESFLRSAGLQPADLLLILLFLPYYYYYYY